MSDAGTTDSWCQSPEPSEDELLDAAFQAAVEGEPRREPKSSDARHKLAVDLELERFRLALRRLLKEELDRHKTEVQDAISSALKTILVQSATEAATAVHRSLSMSKLAAIKEDDADTTNGR
jgi:hypothetical protein